MLRSVQLTTFPLLTTNLKYMLCNSPDTNDVHLVVSAETFGFGQFRRQSEILVHFRLGLNINRN